MEAEEINRFGVTVVLVSQMAKAGSSVNDLWTQLEVHLSNGTKIGVRGQVCTPEMFKETETK